MVAVALRETLTIYILTSAAQQHGYTCAGMPTNTLLAAPIQCIDELYAHTGGV